MHFSLPCTTCEIHDSFMHTDISKDGWLNVNIITNINTLSTCIGWQMKLYICSDESTTSIHRYKKSRYTCTLKCVSQLICWFNILLDFCLYCIRYYESHSAFRYYLKTRYFQCFFGSPSSPAANLSLILTILWRSINNWLAYLLSLSHRPRPALLVLVRSFVAVF